VNSIEELSYILRDSKNVVFFGGGICDLNLAGSFGGDFS
jgi:hypothetical protein